MVAGRPEMKTHAMRQSASLVPTRRLVLLAALVAASIVFLVTSAMWSGIAGAGRAKSHGGHGTNVVSLDSAKLTASVTYANGGGNGGNGGGNGGNGGNQGNGGGTATPEPPSGVLFAIGLVPLALAGIVLTLVRRRSATPALHEE
jgi:hypothetical protein